MQFIQITRLLLTQLVLATPLLAAADLPIGKHNFAVDSTGHVKLSGVPGSVTAAAQPIAHLETPAGILLPTSAELTSDSLSLTFGDDSSMVFAVQPRHHSTLFQLSQLDLKSSASLLRFPRIPIVSGAEVQSTLNAAFHENGVLAVMAGTPEVTPGTGQPSARVVDLDGCSHTFTQTTQSKVGRYAAEFSATNTLPTSGWSMQGRNVQTTVPLEEVTGLSAWIYGDAKGQQIKFQLTDEIGGARDYYVPIDFEGWRHVRMTDAALDITSGKKLAGLNLYFNSLPPDSTVRCLIDDIQVLRAAEGSTVTVPLEDFENPISSWWKNDVRSLELTWDFRHAGIGDSVGIIASPEDVFFDAVQEFEAAAGIIVPRPGGVWNKHSPLIQQSYLFLTSFSENQFDDALDLALRGGFKQILLGQESWCQSTGHYKVNEKNFPGGLPALVRTVERFRSHGIDVGFHLLGASIDYNDAYITPVPDPRLVKDAHTTLTHSIDPQTTTIIVDAMPDGFPGEDGGYNGDGTVLQIGDELIRYTSRTTTAPYTFSGCSRGYHNTSAAAHAGGVAVHHLARSYGYHMFDMDTTMLDEVTSNFAAIANACNIGMIYLDGSERLQGNHARYNARLINAYVSRLKRKDIIVQASSFSHFSWHQLARTASADGHGDLKGYLEQRAPAFKTYKRMGMPLDVGWYYGYDKQATPDMYEYILGTTLGYDSSFSYQVSVAAAKLHPFTGDILQLIRKYDEVRATGSVTDAMRERLKVADALLGKAPEEADRPLHLRRDYHLDTENAHPAFQRIIYGEWQTSDDPSSGTTWQVNLTTGPATVGMQLHVPSPKTANDTASTPTITNPVIQVGDKSLTWNGTLSAGQYLTLWPGKSPIVRGPDAALSMADAATTRTATPALPRQELPQGVHTARFKTDNKSGSTVSYRVRLIFQTPERHPAF